jgi:hypothetical protein
MITRNPIIDLLISGIAISTIVLGVASALANFIPQFGALETSPIVTALAVIPVVFLQPSLRGLRNPFIRYFLAGIIWGAAAIGLGSLTYFNGTGNILGSITGVGLMFYAFTGLTFILAVLATDVANGKFRGI